MKIFENLLKKNVADSPFAEEMREVTSNMYRLGWDERNGGNVSRLLTQEEATEYFAGAEVLRKIPLGFTADEIVRGRYFIVTGTGKYFKNVDKDPETNLGVVKISDSGEYAELLWGFKDGGKFTSEFPAHLMSHAARLKKDPENKVVIHSHPTYTIAMNTVCDIDELKFTKTLWKTNTEAVVVFPDGVGILPCMVCGTNLIGEATAKKMEEYRIVLWTNHGIYGSGKTMDEAFGLIETVEKTAQIYMLTLGKVKNEIPDEVIKGLVDLWHLDVKSGILD